METFRGLTFCCSADAAVLPLLQQKKKQQKKQKAKQQQQQQQRAKYIVNTGSDSQDPEDEGWLSPQTAAGSLRIKPQNLARPSCQPQTDNIFNQS